MNELVRLRLIEPSAVKAANLQTRCAHALELMLTSRGNPSQEIDNALAIDLNCVSAHRLRMALIVRADNNAARLAVVESAEAIEAACPDQNDPARRHAAAARAWLAGDAALALERYGAIVIDHPRDIVALAVAHALDFRLGRRRMLRDRIAQVLTEWSAKQVYYASVLAMYAFGLEENGQYRQAEKTARRSLALDPHHPGAIHVVAHVLEMEGRTREGLAFLDKTETAWMHGTGYSVHLAWHRALFHLDAGDPVSALAAYDKEIVNGAHDMNSLADASALLWRLWLRNVDLADRWKSLADRWETQPLASARAFYLMHAIIAFAAAGRDAAASRAFAALPRVDGCVAAPDLLEDALMHPLCEALIAFAASDYDACVEGLGRVRHFSHQCGGSLAQCDLVQLTFIEAAVRAKKASLARALVAERMGQRPASPLNRLLRQRLQTTLVATDRTFVTGARPRPARAASTATDRRWPYPRRASTLRITSPTVV
jgi:hypothetical protein